MSRLCLIVFVCILFATKLQANPYYYNAARSSSDDDSPCNVIELPGDRPVFILLNGRKVHVQGFVSAQMKDAENWTEGYSILCDKMMVLHKNRTRGVTCIEIRSQRASHYFDPRIGNEVPLSYLPSVVFNAFEFANRKKNGVILDDYGEELISNYMKYLATRMTYQAFVPDKQVTLCVKLIDPYGKLLRNKLSSEQYSYTVTFNTKKTGISSVLELTDWKGKFGKGYRMEIYEEGRRLCTVRIPTRGRIRHEPILRLATPVPITVPRRYVHRRKPQPRDYEYLYKMNFVGAYGDYYIEGWREIEE